MSPALKAAFEEVFRLMDAPPEAARPEMFQMDRDIQAVLAAVPKEQRISVQKVKEYTNVRSSEEILKLLFKYGLLEMSKDSGNGHARYRRKS